VVAVKARRLDLLVEGRVHWLTLYEVCNTLWRESVRLGGLTGEEARAHPGVNRANMDH